MYRIKRKLITIYAFSVFALAALFVVIPVVLFYQIVWPHNEERRLQFHTWLSAFFRWCTRHIPGVSFRFENPHHEDFSRPSIIICNHQSHLDLLCFIALSPRIVSMTNQWVWNFPLYAPVIRYCQFYPASDGLENNEKKIQSLLQRGYSVLIFPEGTRSADCHILKFRRGAFYLAERLQTDILPVYMDGAGKVLPKKDMTIYPGQIGFHIGRRVAAQDLSMGQNYREKTRAWHRHYLQHFSNSSCQ